MRHFCLLVILLCASCGSRPEHLTGDEMTVVVWYVEDVAHGLSRRAAELQLTSASPGLLAVARWAEGNTRDGQQIAHPEPLQARRQRWPLLSRALRDGHIAVTPGGQLRLQPGSTGEDAATNSLLQRALGQENADRAATVQVVLGLGGLRGQRAADGALIDAFHIARRHHAEAAGGELWTTPDSPSSSSSPNAATPSTATPGPSPRRAP